MTCSRGYIDSFRETFGFRMSSRGREQLRTVELGLDCLFGIAGIRTRPRGLLPIAPGPRQ
jgi:hypothetical protein